MLKSDIGRWGEELAVEYLINKNYIIHERNWRFGKAEIDIIAEFEKMLIFVEVKTRSSSVYGLPEEFLSQKQEKLIIDAASQYMRISDYQWAFRFDLVSILRQIGNSWEVRHWEDAFYPDLS